MDPTLQYAQQVGLIQPGPTGTNTGFDPSAANSTPQEQPHTLMDAALTDEDIMAAVVPDYVQDDQPGMFGQYQRDPDAPSAPQPEPTETAQSMSVATKGYSADKNAQVRKGPGNAIDQKIAGIQAEGAVEGAERGQDFVNAAGDHGALVPARDPETGEIMVGPDGNPVMTRLGATGAKGAAAAEADAAVKHTLAMGHEKALLATMMNNYDAQTQETIGVEQAKAATAKANYVAALNEFRGMKVNPAQLWDNMTGSEQLGTLAVAFVQDFLGAKGIHTSAMSTLNKAIDRNIDAQVRNIQTKGQVAEGFKTLWDMQMAESGSVMEARTRMRGFLLESAKTAIESHMASYDAALVSAKGQAVIAKLDEELAKNIFEVNKHQDSKTAARINQALQQYGDELRASMESARIAVAREANKIERDKMKAQAPVNPWDNLVIDNTESGGGRPVAEFRGDISKEEKQKFREAQSTNAEIVRLSREYQSLLNKKGNQGALAGTRWQDTDTARLREVAMKIRKIQAKQFGAALTAEELKVIAAASPEALFGTKYNIGAVLSQAQQHNQDALADLEQLVTVPLHPNDPRRQLTVPRNIQGGTEYKEAGLIKEEQDKVQDIEQVITKGRLKGLEPHAANKAAEEAPPDVHADHERFVSQNPDLFQMPNAPKKGAAPAEKAKYEAELGKAKVSRGVKNFEKELTGLKRDAVGNREKAAEGDEHAAALYKEKVDILRHIASPVTTGTNPNDVQGLYALMVLGDLGEDASTLPSAGTEELGPEVQ